MLAEYRFDYRKARPNRFAEAVKSGAEALPDQKTFIGVMPMQGIQYVTDDSGKKIAVMIDLKKHSELWEDFYDGLTARLRSREPRYSLETVKSGLKKSGKLRG